MTTSPGNHQRDVVIGGDRRNYLVHVPKTYQRNIPVPLLMVLHGGGGSSTFASRVHGWQALSQREECLVVFPEAMPEDPERPATFRENPRIWNDGGTQTAVAKRNVDDVGYLNLVLDDVLGNFAVDTRRIFATGFSNGGSMTFRVGVELSDRLAAIAPVAGHLCIRDPRPARPLSMLYIIGTKDPLNPVNGGFAETPWGARRPRPPVMESILEWIRVIKASSQPAHIQMHDGVTRVLYGPGETGCEIQYYTIEGQGHEWPGAERTLPSSLSGPQTNKMNATRVIWDFFVEMTKEHAS
jgi:polyhydroxybutyrate depolymerase